MIANLDAHLARLDPQAELEFALTCPACALEFHAPFDATLWTVAELERSALELFREVDRLARAYHWREQDILDMPRTRRRRYLDLLDGAPS